MDRNILSLKFLLSCYGFYGDMCLLENTEYISHRLTMSIFFGFIMRAEREVYKNIHKYSL